MPFEQGFDGTVKMSELKLNGDRAGLVARDSAVGKTEQSEESAGFIEPYRKRVDPRRGLFWC